jgi:Ser/Thr protein kinase RdoA (MazF antagonist)
MSQLHARALNMSPLTEPMLFQPEAVPSLDLSFADRSLLAREKKLPGLETLLSPSRCHSWLRRAAPDLHIEAVRPNYLRYKPATSCIAGFALSGPSAPQYVYLKAFATSTSQKLAKVNLKSHDAPRSDQVPIDHTLGIAAWFFPQDAVLKSLASAVSDPAALLSEWSTERPLSQIQVETLRYKPERRFVGRLCTDGKPSAAIKLYTSRDYERARRNAKVLGSLTEFRGPKRIGHSQKHCGLLFEWLSGMRLSELLSDVEKNRDAIEHVGAALAELHLQWCYKLHRVSPTGFAAEMEMAAHTVGAVLPSLSSKAMRLANRLSDRLADSSAMMAACHGDFYADQVLVGAKASVIDLDNAGLGDPAQDIGNFLAHVERAVELDQLAGDASSRISPLLLKGYLTVQPAPALERIQAHTAAGLLKLAIEPFRKRDPAWSDRVESLLHRAESIADLTGRRSGTRASSRNTVEQAVAVDDPFNVSTDDKLPGARAAVNPALVQSLLPNLLKPALGMEVPVAAIRVLRHKSQRRCLVEYGLIDQHDGQSHVVLGKCLRRPVARRDFQTQQRLYNAGFHAEADDGISVPQPLGVFEPWNMWFQRRVPGQPASALLMHEQAHSYAERAAEALYKIHQHGPEPLQTHTIRDELDILHTRLLGLAEERPQWRDRLERLLTACEKSAASITHAPPGPIHRDFYPDQVLFDGPHTFVCDFDLYCLGHPGVDVGNYAAHLIEQGLRECGSITATNAIVESFLQRYVTRTGDVDMHSIETFVSLSLVRHTSISAGMPDRAAFTETILDSCEQRLL